MENQKKEFKINQLVYIKHIDKQSGKFISGKLTNITTRVNASGSVTTLEIIPNSYTGGSSIEVNINEAYHCPIDIIHSFMEAHYLVLKDDADGAYITYS